MARPNYKKLRDALVLSAKEAIRTFAASELNRDVYAVAFDALEDYGTVLVSLNTLRDLERTRNERYSNLSDEQIGGLSGVKYNPGDFSHIGLGPDFPELDSWAGNYAKYLETLGSESAYDRNLERFSDAIVSAIDDLRPDLDLLDQTPDFIVFHGFHDTPDEVKEVLIRKTVDPALFDRIFPEVRQYREFVDGISARPAEWAAQIWLSFFRAYISGERDPLADQFYRQHSRFDIKPQLVEIGELALPGIFSLIDQVMFEPQFNAKGSKEWEAEGAFTRQSNVASELIWTIQEIGVFDDVVEKKLLDYIHRLHEMSKTQKDPIGTNLSVAARTLNAMAPGKYPPVVTDPGTNRPLNIDAYLREAV